MVITTNLIPDRDKFHFGLRFLATSSIAQPGPGPFTVTMRLDIPRTETIGWGILIKSYPTLTNMTIDLGEGLLGSRIAVRPEMQAVEDDTARFSIEARGDTGQVIDTGTQDLKWTWLPTIAKATGLIEGRLITMQNGQSSASSDLQSIIDAVYQRFPHA